MKDRDAALAYAAFEDGNLDAAARHADAAYQAGFKPIQQLVAVIAARRGDYGDAIARLEALEDHGEASAALLIRLHLLAGDAKKGGQLLLDCCKANAFGPPLYPVPRWQGEPLEGRRIVAWGGGLGDDVLYARFLPMLAETHGAEIILQCRPGLVDLFRSLSGVTRVLPLETEVTDCNFHVQTAELAAHFGIARGRMWDGPYLHAAAPLKLSGDGLKVGLVWATTATHWEGGSRSTSLAEMAPLASVPGVQLYSLQFGAPTAQLMPPPEGMAVEDLSDRIKGFANTAAAIAGLDLVITIDTVVANLAGAMGVPVWVATPSMPDWRWGLEGDRTPWFPSATVYRQPKGGSWRELFAAMASDLAGFAQEAGKKSASR